MKSKYTQTQIDKAIDEIVDDKTARDELWKDISGVMEKHVERWLNRSEQCRERAEGIVIKKNGYSRIQCPKCNSIHPVDSIFCNHCGVQIQDSLLEKLRKKNQFGPF
jgi:hypothetical protein